MSLPLRLSNLKPQIEGAPCSPRLVGRTWGRRPHRVSPPARRALCVLRALCALCVKYLSSSVVLRESPRSLHLCVIFRPLSFSPRRPSTSCSCPGKPPICTDRRQCYLQLKLPLQLQLHEFPRSVDYGGLMWHLTPLRINTSKSFRTFRIALTTRDLKPPIINTSMKNALNSSRINTSKRQPGGGSGKTSPRSSPAVRSGGPVRPLVSAPPLPFPAAWSR